MILVNELEYHVIDLKRFKRKKHATGEIADWVNLILGREEKIKMVAKKNKEIEKANRIVEEMSQDPETRELYRLIQKGRIEENTRVRAAYEDGLQAGQEQRRRTAEKRKQKLRLLKNY